MAEKKAKKSITMKKGTATINVAEDRKKHYEKLGYAVSIPTKKPTESENSENGEQ